MQELLVDNRERAVFPFLENIEHEKLQLNTGDFIIRIDGIIKLVIERKTWPDLASSVCDGRVNNVEKLLHMSGETGCKIMYIIEGYYCDSVRLPFHTLESHLFHLIFRDNVIVSYTKSAEDTANFIMRLMKSMSTLKNKTRDQFDFPDGSKTIMWTEGGGSYDLTSIVPKTIDHYVLSMWVSIPKIGEAAGKILMEKYSLSDFIMGKVSDREFMTNVKINGRALSKPAREQLVPWNNGNDIKLLAAVPGISAKTAGILLSNRPLNQLLALDNLADESIGQRKLGKKVAAQIGEYFSFKKNAD